MLSGGALPRESGVGEAVVSPAKEWKQRAKGISDARWLAYSIFCAGMAAPRQSLDVSGVGMYRRTSCSQ